MVAEHRPERHDARAAPDEEERPVEGLLPDEVAADRAAQLELVARPQLVDEVGRDLAVVEPLDRQDEIAVLGRRGDRVAPLRPIAVLGGQADVDVLSGSMPRPVRRVEDDALRARRLVDPLDHGRELPAQSPAYRCSCHGSP